MNNLLNNFFFFKKKVFLCLVWPSVELRFKLGGRGGLLAATCRGRKVLFDFNEMHEDFFLFHWSERLPRCWADFFFFLLVLKAFSKTPSMLQT